MAQRQNSVYKSIANEIISQISSGQFKTGDLLPSEMTLTKKYGVQRTTIRRALTLLEGQYITKLPGKGSVVGVVSAKSQPSVKSSNTKKSGSLIFILPEVSGFIPEHILKVSKHLEAICSDNGIKFISTTRPTASQLSEITNVNSVFGAVFCKGADQKVLDFLSNQKIPTCLLYCQMQGFTSVCTDNDGTMKNIIDSLILLGHSDIYFIANENDYELNNAFTNALSQSGEKVGPDSALIGHGYDDKKTGYDLFKMLYRTKGKNFAVCCVNDKIAQGVISSAKELGVDVPQDISVCSFWGNDKNISCVGFNYLEVAHQVFSQIKLQSDFSDFSNNATTFFYGSLTNNSTISPPKEISKSSRSSISDFLL